MGDREQVTGRAVIAAPQCGANDHAPNHGEPERWSFKDFVVDVPGHVLRDASGRDVPLRRSEFALLVAFLRAPGRALSRDYLLDAVAGRRAESFDRSIDVLVGRLRRHIEPDPKAPRLIITVPGIGYKFVARPRAVPAVTENEPPPTAPPVPVRAAERRLLTIMRCGIFGAGSIAAALDPEDWRDAVANFRGCCAEIIGRFGGIMLPSADHSVVAWFGYPEANELDAERAIHAGLALVTAIPNLRLGSANSLRVHVGIASGLVLISDAGGGSGGNAALGEAPNRAGALLSLAPVNTVLIGANTRDFIGDLFELRALGPVVAEGFDQPIEAWEVAGRGAAEGRFAALRGRNLSPLIGREEELSLLLRRWEQAKQGSGRVVLISAEPGLGKSRLAEALVERIAGDRHLRLRYFCSPHHQDSAFYPVIAQMERAAGFARDDSPEAKLSKLRKLLVESTEPEDAALIAELHALPPADIAPPLDTSSQKKREKTFGALLRQAEHLCRPQPVLMVFEDVHWIDPSSHDLLDRIVEQVANWPVFLVATFRPEFQPPWTGQPHVTMLALARLDRQDTAVMVRNIAGNTLLAADTVQEIAERADGVPLFVEELTQAVVEAGEQLAAISSPGHASSSVPATLHGSLAARLDRLGTAARDVAQKGAAIGREFTYELLASIADLPEPQLHEALEQLTSSGLLFARGTPPHSTYKFKHALVQDAAYGTLLRSRRQQMHARIVAVLESRFSEIAANDPERLAQHCIEAGQAEKAIEYCRRAADASISQSANVEAVRQTGRALEVLRRLPESADRNVRELRLLVSRGVGLQALHGYGSQEVHANYARASEICRTVSDVPELIPVLRGLYVHYLMQGNLPAAHEIGAHLLRLADRVGDDGWRLEARFAFGQTLAFHKADFLQARNLLAEGEALYDIEKHGRHAFVYGQDPGVYCLVLGGWVNYFLGYPDTALTKVRHAIQVADSLGHPLSRAAARTFTIFLLQWLRIDSGVRELAEETIGIAEAHVLPFFHAWAKASLGWDLISNGEVEAGRQKMTAAIQAWLGSAGEFTVPYLRCLLAEAHALAGESEKGLTEVADAFAMADRNQDRYMLSEMHRLAGHVFERAQRTDDAEESYKEAIRVAREQEARSLELRATIDLGRLWARRGEAARTAPLLRPLCAFFVEGLTNRDLVDARSLLEQCARQPSSLTPGELSQ